MSSTKLNVNLEDCLDVRCENCDSEHFSPVFTLKKVSALMSPTGNDMFLPVQIFRCDDCKHVNDEFTK